MRWSSVLCVVALGGVALAGCQGGSGRPTGGPPPASVEVVAIEPQEIRDVAEFAGALTAKESVLVKAETSGIVEEIAFTEGQRVAAGTLLFKLQDDEQRARLQEAKAQGVLAERVWDRAMSLRRDGVLSVEDLDRAGAELAQAAARVELAQVELERTNIRAPFDGVLGARLVSPGDRVTGGSRRGEHDDTGLVQIDAVDDLKLVFSVPEVAIPVMRLGAPVDVGVAPWPDERFHGEIYFVAPSLDPRNRRLLLKALVPNPDGKLRAGLSATVFLEIARHAGALAVPETAIVHDMSGPFVWRVAAGDPPTAERVAVGLGIRQGDVVEILRGLAAGDRVVATGTHKVAAGRPLAIGEPAAHVADAATAP